ncbi:ABC transporter ATP-binding protein [Ferrimonas balearica]|uniref:ABC transporter ATP-binding protein n=1 Tax=Ferrimonas balearica TaxID=44012 RepID=UPI001C994A66|nr:ABC transporter transmembrane domain-containing protein [Ferrimonas balearica]MBY5991767.1 ATP-binding cassette domain-containing protein [Ferrimonas balearica]
MSSTERTGGTFALLAGYIYKDKPLLAKALTLLVLATALDVAGPILAKIFIDDHLLKGDFAPAALTGLLLLYGVTQLGSAWLRYQQTLRFSEMALSAVLDIRRRVFGHVVRLPMSYFDHARTGQLVSRITNDTESIKDLYVQFLSNVLGNAILLIGMLIAMALLDLKLMIIALGLVPTVVLIIYLYQRFSGPAVAHSRALRSDINANISESIAGMAVIQATAGQQRYLERFDEVNQGYYGARMKTVRIGAALLRPAIDMLAVLVLVAIIALFGVQVVEGVAQVGVLYAFLSYMGRFTEPLAEITQRFNLYQQAMVAGDRVSTLLAQEEQHYQSEQAQVQRGAIALKDLRFGYSEDKPVLKGLNLAVPAGGFYAVVGHTGSGKSTLLSLLLNFYPSAPGQIQLDDQDLVQYGHDGLRQGVGLIPQEPFVLAASLYDNIDMGRGLGQAAVESAAKRAHLHHVITALPQGYQTELGEGGMRLSTGQRQQLIIARALAASPKILLLDEATANVDSETEQVVQAALNDLRGEVTLIVVAHRLSTIRHADQIVVLAHGEIIEQGDHASLMAEPEGHYKAMYELQLQALKVAEAEQEELAG